MQNRNDILLLLNRICLTSCFIVLTLAVSPRISAQTLFTVAGTPVSKEEFLKAFVKNNNGAAATEFDDGLRR